MYNIISKTIEHALIIAYEYLSKAPSLLSAIACSFVKWLYFLKVLMKSFTKVQNTLT